VSGNNAITPENVEVAVRHALDAFSEATSVEQLKAAKTAHLGEKSALSVMNATLRDLPRR